MRFPLFRMLVFFAIALFEPQFSVLANTVRIQGNRLLVNGRAFYVKGVCYSPVPTGESPSYFPFGDYFTPDYAYLWKRDLPLLKSLGANTIRIYGWNNSNDHTQFLDEVQSNGLLIFVTYFIGSTSDTPVATEQQRSTVIYEFSKQVWFYKNHPAILMWGFGNEMNGVWNGYLAEFNNVGNCGWSHDCYYSTATQGGCYDKIACVYKGLFGLINDACTAAKKYANRLCTSSFADVDFVITSDVTSVTKIGRFDSLLSAMDVWSIQLYRGKSFGSVFDQYGHQSSKPLLITEYGIDSYNDPCGWAENNDINGSVCFNVANDGNGGSDNTSDFVGCKSDKSCSIPGSIIQSEWDIALTNEIMDHYSDGSASTTGKVSAGGLIMAYHDEYWKNTAVQAWCTAPCPVAEIERCQGVDQHSYMQGHSKGCNWKAHVTCNNWNSSYSDLCGYKLYGTAPDNYVNEGWFGLSQPTSCDYSGNTHRADALRLRPIFNQLRSLWGGTNTVPLTCNQIKPCHDCLQMEMPIGKNWELKCKTCQNVCLHGQCSKNTIPIAINHCLENLCQNGGTCINSIEKYTCICQAGYSGTNCENGMYSGVSCSANSNCLSGLCTSGTCSCKQGSLCRANGLPCNYLIVSVVDRANQCLTGYCAPDGFCACPDSSSVYCLPVGSNCRTNDQCKSGVCSGSSLQLLLGRGKCACSTTPTSCLANGNACPAGQSGVGCKSGYCSDGKCCNNACSKVCQSCVMTNYVGTCKAIPRGYDPEKECGTCGECNGNSGCRNSLAGSTGSTIVGGYSSGAVCIANISSAVSCGLNGKCDGKGKCRYWPTTTECHGTSCSNGIITSKSFCSGNGECLINRKFCGGSEYLYECLTTTQCATSCGDELPTGKFVISGSCSKDAYCDTTAHTCIKKKYRGEKCQSDVMCISSHCSDGICCNKPCQQDCYSCTLESGSCIAVPFGLNPDGHCPLESGCDEDHQCKKFENQTCASRTECLTQVCYKGACYRDLDECKPHPCKHNGTCIDLIANYSCKCMPGYTGQNCSIDIDECIPHPCQNGATCIDKIAHYECLCVKGYDGINCENNINECISTKCLNGAKCIDHIGYANCSCAPGFMGLHCEINIDECLPHPCQHGGICNDGINNFTCVCPPGLVPPKDTFIGNLCQFVRQRPKSKEIIGFTFLTLAGIALLGITGYIMYRRYRLAKKKEHYQLMREKSIRKRKRQNEKKMRKDSALRSHPSYRLRSSRPNSLRGSINI